MLGSVAAQNGALAGIFGDNKGSTAPTSFDAHLFEGDPTAGGTELTGTGYAPVTVTNTSANLGDPSGGQLGPFSIDFGTGAADWGTPDYWAFTDTSGNFWTVQPIQNPQLIIDGDAVTVSATIPVG